MRRLIVLLVWVSVVTSVIAFVLPWARIDVREPALAKDLRQLAQDQRLVDGLTKRLSKVVVSVRRGAETLTGELPELSQIPNEVSGIQIPQMANQENAKVALALLELLTHQRQDIGVKSYAVYLVPGLAILVGILLTWLGRRPAVIWASAGGCAAIAGIGFWTLLTTNTQALFIAITIGPGLWLSLWAYVGLAVSALLVAISLPRRRT